MAACVNCGSEVPEGARICPVCSYPQDQQPAPSPESQQQPPQGERADYQPAVYSPATSAPGYVAAPPTDGQAVAALVLGIIGLPFICPILVPSIIALVLGRQAQKRVEASGGALTGAGIAKAGWILGIIGIVLPVLAILFFVLIGVLAAVGNAGVI